MENLKLADSLAKERAELGICPLPFTHPHIYNHSGITVYPCCPGDNCHAYGKMENGASWEDVWNSEAAKAVRGKILKGDYSECNLRQCATKGRYLATIDYLESAEKSSPLDKTSEVATCPKKRPLDPVFNWVGCYLDPFSKYLRSENLAKLYFLKYAKATGARKNKQDYIAICKVNFQRGSEYGRVILYCGAGGW